MLRSLRQVKCKAVATAAAALGTFLVAIATPASVGAQTAGRLSVGVGVTQVHPRSDELGSSIGIGGIVRGNPRPGWGVDLALNWFSVVVTPMSESPRGALTVRPVLFGPSYTLGPPSTRVSFSFVAGPSFDSIEFYDSTESDTFELGLAARPGVSVTQSLAPRLGVVASAGYLLHRRGAIVRARSLQARDAWNADAVVLSIAAVYSLF